MWHPPENVRHALPVLRAPSAEEVASARLFAPLMLPSELVLADRTWVPAMVPWRASPEGEVTDDVVDWYRRFAEGQPGVIVVEATGIADVPSGPLLRIGHDRFIAGLTRIVEAVREASGGRTRLFIQLIDFLALKRRPPRDRFLREFLAIDSALMHRLAARGVAVDEPSARQALLAMDDAELATVLSARDLEALEKGARERVTDVHLPHVRELPRTLPLRFAEAAARAQRAGFDGVELHYAHAYTMASFLSATNDRADGYGGAREQRARLPLEVLRAVRLRVGPRYTVGLRMLADEIVEGGSRVDDAAYFAVEFALASADYLSLSTGGKFDDAKAPKVGEAIYPYTGPSGYACMPTVRSDARGPFGRNVATQAKVRAALHAAGLSTPVVVAGGIATFDQAEAILRDEQGDLVAAARQTLADPDWFLKLRTGRADRIRRCLFTNYCEALDQKHKMVTCQQWDRSGLAAPGVKTTADGRRRTTAPRDGEALDPTTNRDADTMGEPR
jgi:2,4-dienoyl-CoA reductase-like NADH-dependent reductase (Old Yellow Enzyme family)